MENCSKWGMTLIVNPEPPNLQDCNSHLGFQSTDTGAPSKTPSWARISKERSLSICTDSKCPKSLLKPAKFWENNVSLLYNRPVTQKVYGPKTSGVDITQKLVKQIPHFNKSPVIFARANLRSIDLEQGSENYGLWAISGLFLSIKFPWNEVSSIYLYIVYS